MRGEPPFGATKNASRIFADALAHGDESPSWLWTFVPLLREERRAVTRKRGVLQPIDSDRLCQTKRTVRASSVKVEIDTRKVSPFLSQSRTCRRRKRFPDSLISQGPFFFCAHVPHHFTPYLCVYLHTVDMGGFFFPKRTGSETVLVCHQ